MLITEIAKAFDKAPQMKLCSRLHFYGAVGPTHKVMTSLWLFVCVRDFKPHPIMIRWTMGQWKVKIAHIRNFTSVVHESKCTGRVTL